MNENYHRIFLLRQTHIAKHNGRTQKPTLNLNPAIELVCRPTLTLPTLRKLNVLKTEKTELQN